MLKKLRVLSALLALLMVALLPAVLTGCAKGEKEKLVGDWKCELDVTEYMEEKISEAIGESVEDADAFDVDLDGMVMTLNMTFNEDDTYSLGVDEEGLTAMMGKMIDPMKAALKTYLESTFEAMAEENGMALEEFKSALESQLGMTYDEYIDQTMEEALSGDGLEQSLGGSMDSMNSAGKYRAEKGKLFYSDDKGEEPTEYTEYEWSGDELLLKDVFDDSDDASLGEEDKEFFESLLPLRFKKVK